MNLRLLLSLSVGAVPAAYVGGGLEIPSELFRPLLGVILFLAALRLFLPPASERAWLVRSPSTLLAMTVKVCFVRSPLCF